MNKHHIIELSKQYSLSPIKKLGQNFLIDDGLTEKIINAVSPDSNDAIIEIGPGFGALTKSLIQKAGSVTAVEIDAGIVKVLQKIFKDEPSFNLIHGDFLKVDLSNNYNKVVSNLPYYCSSEILFRIAHEMPGAREVYVMVQKEMADRITSQPGTKSYGALTLNLGLYFNIKSLFKVPASCFYPRPEVASLFIKLVRKEMDIFDEDTKKCFHDLVKSAFWGRRKTISTALAGSPHIDFARNDVSHALQSAGIDPVMRAEDLGLNQYIELTKIFYGIKNK